MLQLSGQTSNFGQDSSKMGAQVCLCKWNNKKVLVMEVVMSWSFESVVSIHCMAALNLRAGVVQPLHCLIIQNRQAVQSTGRSMDWTCEDDMVDGLFFCATLTGRRGAIPHFYKQERKHPTPVRRHLSRIHAVLGRVTPGW